MVKPVNRAEATTVEVPDEYDPHLYRDVPHPTTNWDTLVHMLKGAFGTGILAMPEAFKHSGLLVGFIFTLVIGTIITYGLHILIASQYVLCKRLNVPFLTYPDSMKAALLSGPKCFQYFANAAPILVDFFLIIYQLGICCCYVIFVAENLKKLMDDYLPEEVELEVYTAFLLIPFILIMYVPTLKWLAPVSLVSNIITIGCFAMVLSYVFKDLPPIDQRPLSGPITEFPLFFGTTLFALEAVGVIIALEKNMETPKNFRGCCGVLNIAMFISTMTYLTIGFFGFWHYGDDIEASITLNLPSEDIMAKVIQGAYSVAIFMSYSLQGFLPIDIMWNTYLAHKFSNRKYPIFYEYILRTVTVLVTFLVAITIPLLGLFISLFGAFCLSVLGIIFPAIMEICVKWPNDFGYMNWILVKGILLIITGLFTLVAGSVTALLEIITKMTEKK